MAGNLDSTERDGSGGLKPYNDYSASDSTTVSVDCPTLEKSIVATSEASTTGNNVAIGEIVRYRLLTTLPEGTAPNFQIHDFLPVGMQFLNDGTAKVSLVSDAGFTSGLIGANQTLLAPPPTYVLLNNAVSTSATINDDTYGDGTDVFFKLGTLVNNDNDANAEYVVLEFNALVLNKIANQAGVPLDNSYIVTVQSCVDFVGGVEDAYSLRNVETTAISPGLSARLTNLNVTNSNLTGYDSTTVNRIFADSFTGLPTNITSAQLRIGLKPLDDQPENDSFSLGVYSLGGTPVSVTGSGNTSVFGSSIATLTGSWTASSNPTVLTLDLNNLPNGLSLLSAMNLLNKLDVILQDDTAVDFLELCVTTDDPNNPSMQIGLTSNPVTVVVVEPQLINIGKEYTSQTLPNGQLSATFDVSFSNANGPFSSTAFDTHVLDQLTPFLALTPNTLTVIRNGFYTLGPSEFVNNSTSGTVDVTINQIAPGDTIQLFYTVTTTSVVQPTQHIKNIANVTYTSLPGTNGTNPNPTGSVTPGIPGSMTGERDGSNAPVIGSLNDYFDMSMATITAASPAISKTIIATSNPSTGTSQFNPLITDLAVAEYVTYQLTFSLPAGTTSPLIVRDNLPTGSAGVMRYFGSSIVSIGSGIGPGTLVPAVVSDTDGDLINDQVAYNFGTRTVAPGAVATRQIVVQVVAQVVNSAVNRLGKVLTNTANLFYGLGTISTNVNAEVGKRSKPWWFENLTLKTGVDVPLTPVRANPNDSSNMGNSVLSLVGSFVPAPNAALPLGVAIIGADNAHGDWQYSTNGGTDWIGIGSTSPMSAVVLSAEPKNRVRFVPAPGFTGTVMPGLTYQAWDRSNGPASGTMKVDSFFDVFPEFNSRPTVDLPFSNQVNTASIRVMAPVNAQVTLPNTVNSVIVSRTGTGPGALLRVRMGTVDLLTPAPINQFGNLQINGGSAADNVTLDATLNGFYFGTFQILGNGGNDVLNGTAFVAPNLNAVILSGGNGNDTLSGGNGPDNLDGGAGDDVLIGNAGNDVLDGGAGDDKLTGNAGNDSLLGGIGSDTVNASGGMNYILTDTSLMGDGSDTLGQIEAALLTTGNLDSSIDASAFSGSGTSTLNGGNGNDVIIGSSSNDIINGGAGNDTLQGGGGNDIINGGAGNDAIAGQAGDDMLFGGDGNDVISGGVGNDTLKGGIGNDVLIGGFGVDSIDGEAGNDTALGGQGKIGAPRFGNSLKDLGDLITAEVINEVFATLFAFE